MTYLSENLDTVSLIASVLISTMLIWAQAYSQAEQIKSGKFIQHERETRLAAIVCMLMIFLLGFFSGWKEVLAYGIGIGPWRLFFHHVFLNMIYRSLPLGYLGVGEDGGGLDRTDSETDKIMYILGGESFAAFARVFCLIFASVSFLSPYIYWAYFTTPISEL